jgi:hypothetical protein
MVNSNVKQPKQSLISNGLWSSTLEMREELNIPISVKHAKMCFENLASNKNNPNIMRTTATSLFETPPNKTANASSTTLTPINSIVHPIPITPITPNLTSVNRLRSELLVTTKKISSSSPLNDQKQRLSPICRKSSTPSPILSSSSSSESSSSSDHQINVKMPHVNSIHVSSSNGSVSSGVSEIINLFSSSSASSNSNKSTRHLDSSNHVIPLSSSPTAIYNSNSSSSAAASSAAASSSSSSSSSSCETTPRSTLNSKKQRPPKVPNQINLDLDLSMNQVSNDFQTNKCPSVANKIKKLEQTFTTSSSTSGSNSSGVTKRVQSTKSLFENQNQVKQQHHSLFGSPSSSSTSSFSSSASGSYLNNGDLPNFHNKLDKNPIQTNIATHQSAGIHLVS